MYCFLGSITLHKWHDLASENVVAGLNVGNVLTPQKEAADTHAHLPPCSPNEYDSTLDNTEPDTRLEDLDNDIFEAEDEDFGITFKADNTVKKGQNNAKAKQSTPVQASQRTLESLRNSVQAISAETERQLGGLSSLAKRKSSKPDRSIITRTSSLLDSLREGRAMLTKEGANGKSRADAIDILAHAMNKANVEAKTGQRILESVNENSRTPSALSTDKKAYQDMPKLNKVLERLASNKNGGKVDLSAVQPALKILLEKAAGVPKPQDKSRMVPKASQDSTKVRAEEAAPKPDMALPSLLRGPTAMRVTPGILGSILQSSNSDYTGSSILPIALSSNANTASVMPAKPTLTRSWSSGDLKTFTTDNLLRLNSVDSSIDSSNLGRMRHNSSSGADLASLANSNRNQPLGLGFRRRTNSSGSLMDLVKQADVKAVPSGSPPMTASFVSFDNYGGDDFFGHSYADSSSSVGTASTVSQATTSTASKPAGFLRNLFLGPSNEQLPVESKRPSSVHEAAPNTFSLGAGSSASAESGMNRFGKPTQKDNSSGFGFGFMSYFSGSKK